MGLLDSLTGAFGAGTSDQAETRSVPGLISAALAKTSLGSLQGVVTQLQQGGLDTQVQSWLGTGENLPVTSDQLRSALGGDQVRQLAQYFGVAPDAAMKLLSELLPSVVDKASPNGALEPTP
jgi:uncharacterized protein YidB (DUF937 family)